MNAIQIEAANPPPPEAHAQGEALASVQGEVAQTSHATSPCG